MRLYTDCLFPLIVLLDVDVIHFQRTEKNRMGADARDANLMNTVKYVYDVIRSGRIAKLTGR